MEHVEHKISDMNRLQAKMTEGGRGAYGAQVIQLQQQVTDLRSSLAEATSQNAELEKTSTQLQLKLERCKRYMRRQNEGLKVRKEMEQLLQHKDAADGNLDGTEQVSAFLDISSGNRWSGRFPY